LTNRYRQRRSDRSIEDRRLKKYAAITEFGVTEFYVAVTSTFTLHHLEENYDLDIMDLCPARPVRILQQGCAVIVLPAAE